MPAQETRAIPKLAGENPLNGDFGKLAQKLLKELHVPGLSVAVVDGDNTWTEGYGIATFPDISVTPSTLFYAGSTTKAHVTAALAHIIETGKHTTDTGAPLSWDSPIASVLRDDFVLADKWATQHITLADAASHRTGMARHDKAMIHLYDDDSQEGGGTKRRVATPRDVVRALRHFPLSEEPRVKFQYCNPMYVVLSHVIETLHDGRRLSDVLRELLWLPLGMSSTHFSLGEARGAAEHLARGYFWDESASKSSDCRSENGGKFEPYEFQEVDELSGAGAVISSAEDYARWMRFWIDEEQPLSKAAHRTVKTPLCLTDGMPRRFDTPQTYAAGWFTGSYRGQRWWSHTGGLDAYGSEIWIFPDLRFGVATLGNTAITSNAVGQHLIGHLIDNKLGILEEDRQDWSKDFMGFKELGKFWWNNAPDVLFPNRVDPPIPPSLPFEKYAGTYYHPGYNYMKLQLGPRPGGRRPNAQFFAERLECTWQRVCDFEHVSGEFWVMYMSVVAGTAEDKKDTAAVQFRVGVNGQVSTLGIEWRFGPLVDGWIWYDKVRNV